MACDRWKKSGIEQRVQSDDEAPLDAAELASHGARGLCAVRHVSLDPREQRAGLGVHQRRFVELERSGQDLASADQMEIGDFHVMLGRPESLLIELQRRPERDDACVAPRGGEQKWQHRLEPFQLKRMREVAARHIAILRQARVAEEVERAQIRKAEQAAILDRSVAVETLAVEEAEIAAHLFCHPVILGDDHSALIVGIGAEHQREHRARIFGALQPLMRRTISQAGQRVGNE